MRWTSMAEFRAIANMWTWSDPLSDPMATAGTIRAINAGPRPGRRCLEKGDLLLISTPVLLVPGTWQLRRI